MVCGHRSSVQRPACLGETGPGALRPLPLEHLVSGGQKRAVLSHWDPQIVHTHPGQPRQGLEFSAQASLWPLAAGSPLVSPCSFWKSCWTPESALSEGRPGLAGVSGLAVTVVSSSPSAQSPQSAGEERCLAGPGCRGGGSHGTNPHCGALRWGGPTAERGNGVGTGKEGKNCL